MADCFITNDPHHAGREIPETLAAETDHANEFPNSMWEKLGEAGLLGVTVEEEHGGLAMGYQAHCVIMEELSRASGTYGRIPQPQQGQNY